MYSLYELYFDAAFARAAALPAFATCWPETATVQLNIANSQPVRDCVIFFQLRQREGEPAPKTAETRRTS
jgi:hypothetical protein